MDPCEGMDAENCTFLVNHTINATECRYGYCVEVTLYRQILGTIIFLAIWPFIVFDMKIFPLGRPAAALLGATFMVITTVITQDQVFAIVGNKGNLQTICLLLGMMFLSYYYDREGLLYILTLWIFGTKKPFRYVLWKICVLSAVLSATISNDAACIVLTPILIREHIKQGRSCKELPALLLGIATSANIGSAATFFGNPQNAFIAASSGGEVSLIIFFATTLPAAVLGTFLNILLLYVSYYKVIFLPTPEENEADGENKPTQLPKQSNEQNNTDEWITSFSIDTGATDSGSNNQVKNETTSLTKSDPQKTTWKSRIFIGWLIIITAVVVILLAIPPPPTITAVRFNLGLVPLGAAMLTILLDVFFYRKDAYDVMSQVDWGVILLFFGLFVWLQGLENTGFPDMLFKLALPYMNLSTVQGILFFTVFITIGSNILSNVPLVILVVHNLSDFNCGDNTCSVQLTGILLAWVSTIAGNFTLIGSVANLIVAEKARTCGNYRLTFWTYLKFGFITTSIVLFVGLPVVYFSGKFVDLSM